MIECFIRTVRAECLYRHDLEGIEEARAVSGRFIQKHNIQWTFERHDYMTSTEARRAQLQQAA